VQRQITSKRLKVQAYL